MGIKNFKSKTIIFLILTFFIIPFITSGFGYNNIDQKDEVNVITLTGNITNFLHLTDTPGSFSGEGGNCVIVNVGETALEFGACGAGTLDGNASSICANGEVLMGDGYCLDLNDTIDDRVGAISDTNETTRVNVLNETIQSSNESWLSTFNKTYSSYNSTYNSTYDSKITDNESWNQSLADTLYTAIGAGADNASWNESLAATLFADISVTDTTIANASECPDHQVLTGNGYCLDLNATISDLDTAGSGDVVNNTHGWVLNFTTIYSLDWSNITLLESQITDLVHTTDTNVTTVCSTNHVLLGNGSCMDIDTIGGDSDTNETTRVNVLNETIQSSNESWLSTANVTYGNINVSSNIQFLLNLTNALFSEIDASGINGSSFCILDVCIDDWSSINESGADGNWFADQNVNLTSNVTFYALNLTDWGNVTITESQIRDLVHTIDTNLSSFKDNLTSSTCGVGKAIGVQENGSLTCAADETGTGGKSTSSADSHLFNDTVNIYYNETHGNQTIVLRGMDAGFNETHNATYDSYSLNVSTNWTERTRLTYNETWSRTDNETYENINTTANIQFLLNYTDMVFNILNVTRINTTDLCILGVCISDWDSINQTAVDTNDTAWVINATNNDCPAGNYSYGFYINGTKKCRDDLKDGKTTDPSDTYLYNDTTVIYFNSSALSSIYHNATQSKLYAGVLDGGTLGDVSHPDGGYDGTTLNFSEASGSPGLDLRVNFTGITSFSRGVMRYKTSGLSGDYPIRQLWNYDESAWEDYPVLSETLSFSITSQTIYDYSDHVQDGVIQMRMYKAGNGNTNNHYYIDWVTMVEGFGVPSGQEVDPLWTNEKHDYYNITDITRMNNSWLSTQNTTYENINVSSNIQFLLNATSMFFNALNATSVNASKFCIWGICISDWGSVNSSSTYNATYDSYSLNVSTNWTERTRLTYNETWSRTDNETYENINVSSNIQFLINGSSLNLGDLNITNKGNITIDTNASICMSPDCSQWFKCNATGCYIQG